MTGICAHVRNGGGGLTPSDIAPARLNQHQIDELQQQFHIADVLPLYTPATGVALPRQHRTKNFGDLYAMQLDITVTGALDPDRLRDAVQTVVHRHPNLAAHFCEQFDQPIQVIPVDPIAPWRYPPKGWTPKRRSNNSVPPNVWRSATSPTHQPSARR